MWAGSAGSQHFHLNRVQLYSIMCYGTLTAESLVFLINTLRQPRRHIRTSINAGGHGHPWSQTYWSRPLADWLPGMFFCLILFDMLDWLILARAHGSWWMWEGYRQKCVSPAEQFLSETKTIGSMEKWTTAWIKTSSNTLDPCSHGSSVPVWILDRCWFEEQHELTNKCFLWVIWQDISLETNVWWKISYIFYFRCRQRTIEELSIS